VTATFSEPVKGLSITAMRLRVMGSTTDIAGGVTQRDRDRQLHSDGSAHPRTGYEMLLTEAITTRQASRSRR
jgi:hypothetical protein